MIRIPPMATIVRFLLIMVCLVPLMVSPNTLYPFIVGKAIYARVMIEIAFALWLVLITYAPENRPRHSWVLVALFVWLGVSVAAGVFGASFTRSLWSDYLRMDGLIDLAHWCVYAVMVASMFRTLNQWKQLLWVVVLVSGVVAVIGIFGYLFPEVIPLLAHKSRLSSTLGNALFLGSYACLSIGFVVALLTLVRDRRDILLLIGIGVLNMTILWLSGSRGGLITLAIMALVFAVGYVITSSNARRRAITMMASVLGAGILLFVLLALVSNASTLGRFGSALPSESDNSIDGRVAIAKAALHGYAERPLLGFGPQNFSVVWGKYVPSDWNDYEKVFSDSHNIFLEVMVTTGTLGIVAYGLLCALLIGVAIKRVFSSRGNFPPLLDLAMAVTLMGYLVVSMVMINTSTFALYFAVLIGYLAYKGGSFRVDSRFAWVPSLRPRRIAAVAGLLLAPALVYVLFQYNGNVLLSSQMPLTKDAPVAYFIINEWQLMNHFLPMANTRRLVLMDAAWVLGDGEFAELIADNVDAAIAAEPENWLLPYAATRMYLEIAINDPKYADRVEHYLLILEDLFPSENSVYVRTVREMQDDLEQSR